MQSAKSARAHRSARIRSSLLDRQFVLQFARHPSGWRVFLLRRRRIVRAGVESKPNAVANCTRQFRRCPRAPPPRNPKASSQQTAERSPRGPHAPKEAVDAKSRRSPCPRKIAVCQSVPRICGRIPNSNLARILPIYDIYYNLHR